MEQVEHINFRHVEVNDQRASKSKQFQLKCNVGLADAENAGNRSEGVL